MLGFQGLDPQAGLKAQLEVTGARGVILFARNIRSADQTRDLIQEIRSLVSWPLLIAVDQEGGPVVRVQRGGTLFPGNMALGASDDPELAERQGDASGRQLAAMGFDLNLAPVVDLQTNPLNPGIGIRSLGADRRRAAHLAEALVRGHQRHGVHSCLKHFPGKGAASVDAHRALPVLDLPLEAFRDPHLQIFADLLAALSPAPAIMTSHVVVTGLDPRAPATLSPAITRRVLREQMGFSGLVLTDDLEMGAIVAHGGVGAAAELAAAAGHDLILVCHDPERQRDAARTLERALESGTLSRSEHAAAVGRIEDHARSAAAARAAQAGYVDPTSGDRIAEEIAARAVHLFGDSRSLLPLTRSQRCGVVAFRPRAIVDVEETRSDGGFAGQLRGSLIDADLEPSFVQVLESTESVPSGVLDSLEPCDRVLFYTWDALRQESVRELLEALCERFQDRMIVVHLRNPFDQSLVPENVTALTAFGYHPCQLRAVARVIAGRAPADGRMPAPLRA